MDNKKENIIENEIEVQVKEDNGAVLEYARRLAKFSDGKGDKMDDGPVIHLISFSVTELCKSPGIFKYCSVVFLNLYLNFILNDVFLFVIHNELLSACWL